MEILYSQLTFRFLGRIPAARVPCRVSSQVVVLEILKVLLNGLAGIKCLSASSLLRKATQAFFKFGTQANGQHAEQLATKYLYRKPGFPQMRFRPARPRLLRKLRPPILPQRRQPPRRRPRTPPPPRRNVPPCPRLPQPHDRPLFVLIGRRWPASGRPLMQSPAMLVSREKGGRDGLRGCHSSSLLWKTS